MPFLGKGPLVIVSAPEIRVQFNGQDLFKQGEAVFDGGPVAWNRLK